MVHMRHHAFRGLVVAMVVALSACGDSRSPTDAATAALVATWDIRTVDGQPLPYVETEDFGGGLSCSLTLVAGHVVFRSNGRYDSAASGSFECTGLGSQTFDGQAAGSWRVSGNTLFLQQDPDEDGPYEEQAHTYSISGRTLTMTDTDPEGTVVVLERR
jgi:hypothetical protein